MKTAVVMSSLAVALAPIVASADPPERVARISFLSGTTSFRTASATEWSPASLNYPVTIGDHVWTDRAGRLELQMGATAVDFDALTAASVLNLDHHIVQLRLVQGSMIARVREIAGDESVEIDTPNSAITLLGPGLYRIDVPPTGDAAMVTVRRGDADIAAGASAFPVHAGESVSITSIDTPTHALVATTPLDEFEDWAMFRDRRVEAVSARYVPRAVVGYEDLDAFGTWRVVADYGPVWVPHVRPAWAPYRFGHWAWVDPWGWTWIDDAPWGFAPFHYGRWAYVGDGWVWAPGAIVARPVYAPALVAFVGGAGWRVGVSVGSPVGWFPLGPREVYVPAYGVSPAYVAAVNRPHASVTNINVSVTNITYVNRSVPGAVTVVSREDFAQARPVAAAAVPVPAQALGAAVVVGHSAPREIAPVAIARAASVAVPPAAVTSRAVVARTLPPAAPAAPPVRRVAAGAPGPARPAAALSTAPAAPVPSPPSPAVTRAAPDRVAADVAARHEQELVALEARHAAEQAALRARQAEAAGRAATAQAQADVHARYAREQAALATQQKREHVAVHARQDAERKAR